jgi:hypothetical protein
MLSLEREVLAAPLPEDAKARIAALERRAIVPVRAELRALLWLGVALISGGAGVLLAQNIEKIGHLTLIIAIAVAAATCYVFAWRFHRRNGPAHIREENGPAQPVPTTRTHIAAEYLLLLGALLLSADLAYAEVQLQLFGGAWRWHLVILAIAHGAAAYQFASTKVLSLAIVALAGIFGVDRSGAVFSNGAGDAAARLALAAAAVALWRVAHERASRLATFEFPLEQAAFHLAMIASVTALFDETLVWIALGTTLALALVASLHAVRTSEESFLVFSILYAVFAIDAVALPRFDDTQTGLLWMLLTTPLAIAALYFIHRRWKERFA